MSCLQEPSQAPGSFENSYDLGERERERKGKENGKGRGIISLTWSLNLKFR